MLRIAVLAVAMLYTAAAGAQPLDDVPVTTRTLAASGTHGQISFSYRIDYPQVDSRKADFSALNTRFHNEALKAASRAVPCADCGVDRAQKWYATQEFTVERPSRRSILIMLNAGTYTGGAHPYSGRSCRLIDLRTGREAGPSEIFRDGWLDALVPMVRADLRRQFAGGKPGFEQALESKPLADLLRNSSSYCWGRGMLTLHFNPYDVGPYVSGSFEVKVPVAALQAWIAPDGPIGE